MESKKVTVLFTGYAPVHFVCFESLFEKFMQMDEVEVYVSGGLRTKTKSGYQYDAQGLYHPFDVPADRILTVDQIRLRSFDVLFSANTKLIKPLEVKTCVQLFHGISFRNRAIRMENMGCDYYFLVGPYMRKKFTQPGMFQENDPRALSIGFPKTDRLLNQQLRREHLLEKYGFDDTRPLLLYAPTGQKHNSLETMGEDVIRNLVESKKYNLLVKLHDHPKNKNVNWHEKLTKYENGHMRLVKDFDIVPYLHAADLLITDASSVSSEYSLVNRPMVFLDVPKLIKRAKKADGSMLDMDTWGRRGGELVKNKEDLVSVVEQSLQCRDNYASVRSDMASDLFYNPGCATEAAIEWFEKTFLK